MGRESASYRLAMTAADAETLARGLDAAGLECWRDDDLRVDYVLRDPHRYWVDLRVHRRPQPRLEIRIALTNDTWTIRAPIERALTPLPPCLQGVALRDDDGNDVAVAGDDGWLLAVEDDFGRLRDDFVARVGDYSAPLSADHVYMYLHQTRWNQDNDDELAWHREREIARLEESWADGGRRGGSQHAGEAPEPQIGDS